MSAGESRLPAAWSRPGSYEPPKFFRLSQLRKLRGCEQVAAVCYRVRNHAIEFLLVQTRGGRWIFPKGSAEAGLSNAQAAALEAFEEAGVHGRIEEAPFVRYIRRKNGDSRTAPAIEVTTNAYLCAVSRLDAPQEANRNPTWLSTEKAKRRLREERQTDFANELCRVIDRATIRIRQLHRGI
jgi:8-oxo-dGTP pyrophosphatase MutT (NUDIX family)